MIIISMNIMVAINFVYYVFHSSNVFAPLTLYVKINSGRKCVAFFQIIIWNCNHIKLRFKCQIRLPVFHITAHEKRKLKIPILGLGGFHLTHFGIKCTFLQLQRDLLRPLSDSTSILK